MVVGLGAAGALLAVRGEGVVGRFPAVAAPRIVSTVGAGDALLAAFVHGYARDGHPRAALQHAMAFAAHKIGAVGAADGFLTERVLAARARGRESAG